MIFLLLTRSITGLHLHCEGTSLASSLGLAQEALDVDVPFDASVHLKILQHRSFVYIKMNKYVEAQADLLECLKISKDHGVTHNIRVERTLQEVNDKIRALGGELPEGEERSSGNSTAMDEETKKDDVDNDKDDQEETDDEMPPLEEDSDDDVDDHEMSDDAFVAKIRASKECANQLFAARKLADAETAYHKIMERIEARSEKLKRPKNFDLKLIKDQCFSNIIAVQLKQKKYSVCLVSATLMLENSQSEDISLKLKTYLRRGKAYMGMNSYEEAKADFEQVLSLSKDEKKFKKIRERALQCLKTISTELGNDSDDVATDDDMPSLVFDTDEEEEESSPQQSISKKEEKKKKKKRKRKKKKKKKKSKEEQETNDDMPDLIVEEETDDEMPDLMFNDAEEEKESTMMSEEERFMNEIRSLKKDANSLFAARKFKDALTAYKSIHVRICEREKSCELSNEAIIIRLQVLSNIIAGLLKEKRYTSVSSLATQLLQHCELDISLKIKALYRRGKARWELKQLKGAKSDFEQVLSLSLEDVKKFQKIRADSIECLKSISSAEADESFVTNEPEVVSPEEAMRQLQILRSKGNQLFKQKRYKEAKSVYHQGLHSYMTATFEHHSDLRHSLLMKMMANLSACHLKLKQYKTCIETCDQLIEGSGMEDLEMPIKIKTLYRRGKSKFELQQFEDAKLDFESVISLTESQDFKKKFRSIREESMKCLKSISGEESTDEDMPELDFSDDDDI